MCKQCQTNPVYVFTNKRQLCKTCFIRYFNKKFLYINRKFDLLKKRDIVFFKKTNNFRDVVLDFLLKSFSEKVGYVRVSRGKDYNVVVNNSSIDVLAYEITKKIMQGKAKDLKEFYPIIKKGKIKSIKPLYLFLDKEILLYAKIKKLKCSGKKFPKDKIEKFIDSLEEKHPEIKRAIVNSYLKLFF